MSKLFVYGIFLDQHARDSFGMTGEHYATVRDYATVGGKVVAATRADGYCLTGLVVDMPDTREVHWSRHDEPTRIDNWQGLDFLESGYERVKIKTTDGEKCWLYVARY